MAYISVVGLKFSPGESKNEWTVITFRHIAEADLALVDVQGHILDIRPFFFDVNSFIMAFFAVKQHPGNVIRTEMQLTQTRNNDVGPHGDR